MDDELKTTVEDYMYPALINDSEEILEIEAEEIVYEEPDEVILITERPIIIDESYFINPNGGSGCGKGANSNSSDNQNPSNEKPENNDDGNDEGQKPDESDSNDMSDKVSDENDGENTEGEVDYKSYLLGDSSSERFTVKRKNRL